MLRANLLKLEVDLLFFDGSSTHWERDGEDDALLDDEDEDQLGEQANPVEGAARGYGRSKDHRNDLPQVVIGLAVTRQGIPVRMWTFPGDTSEQLLLRTVKDDLREWNLNRVIWVVDRGFSSAANRRFLQRGGGHYIMGEKLRSDSAEAKHALGRAGRYRTVAGNLRVKEARIDDGTARDRFALRRPCMSARGRGLLERGRLFCPGLTAIAAHLGDWLRGRRVGRQLPGRTKHLRMSQLAPKKHVVDYSCHSHPCFETIGVWFTSDANQRASTSALLTPKVIAATFAPPLEQQGTKRRRHHNEEVRICQHHRQRARRGCPGFGGPRPGGLGPQHLGQSGPERDGPPGRYHRAPEPLTDPLALQR